MSGWQTVVRLWSGCSNVRLLDCSQAVRLKSGYRQAVRLQSVNSQAVPMAGCLTIVRLWSCCQAVRLVRLWSGCSQAVVRLLSGCRQAVRVQSGYRQAVRLQSDCSQAVKLQSDCQTVVRMLSCCQTVVQLFGCSQQITDTKQKTNQNIFKVIFKVWPLQNHEHSLQLVCREQVRSVLNIQWNVPVAKSSVPLVLDMLYQTWQMFYTIRVKCEST